MKKQKIKKKLLEPCAKHREDMERAPGAQGGGGGLLAGLNVKIAKYSKASGVFSSVKMNVRSSGVGIAHDGYLHIKSQKGT